MTIASGKTYTWTAGGMAGTGTTTIAAGGTLTISGTVGVGRTITNNGTISWTAGQIQMVDGTIDNNAAFTAQPDNSMANFGGTNAFNNNASGTFTRNTGTGFLDINIPFTNVGTTTVSTGTLRIAGGGTSTGTINAASAAVNFTNNYDVTAGTFNVGTLTLSGGTINMTPGTYTVATANLISSTYNLNKASAASNWTQSGGSLSGSGAVTIASGKTYTWTAGGMAGTGTTTIAAGGTLTISGTVGVGRTITNNGTISWTAGQIQMVDGTIDNNAAFTAQPDNSMANFGGTNAFNNNASGTFTRNTGTGFLDINIPFTNVGTTTVSTGTLRIAGGGTSTGTINAASAAVNFTNNYDVTAGTFNVGTLTLSGGTINMTPGTYTVATANLISSTYNLNKASAASNWTQSGGSLSGSGAVTIASGKTYAWTAGGMAGTGTTTIAAGGTLTIGGTVGVGRTITNNGTISWTAGQIQMVDGTIDNNAAFTAQPDNSMANFGGTNAFNNNASGTFTRNTGTGFLDINIPFTNVGTTTVSTGTLRIAGGGTSTGTINAASAAVNFTNNYDVTAGTFNVGTLTLSGGTINMTPGTYTVATANLISSTYNLNKASAASNWTQSGGSLSGSGAVTIASGKTYAWTAGGMAGTGTTTIAAGGTLTIGGTVGVGRTITNNGTISWTAGQIQMVDGTIDNNTTLSLTNDDSMANFGGTNALQQQRRRHSHAQHQHGDSLDWGSRQQRRNHQRELRNPCVDRRPEPNGRTDDSERRSPRGRRLDPRFPGGRAQRRRDDHGQRLELRDGVARSFAGRHLHRGQLHADRRGDPRDRDERDHCRDAVRPARGHRHRHARRRPFLDARVHARDLDPLHPHHERRHRRRLRQFRRPRGRRRARHAQRQLPRHLPGRARATTWS